MPTFPNWPSVNQNAPIRPQAGPGGANWADILPYVFASIGGLLGGPGAAGAGLRGFAAGREQQIETQMRQQALAQAQAEQAALAASRAEAARRQRAADEEQAKVRRMQFLAAVRAALEGLTPAQYDQAAQVYSEQAKEIGLAPETVLAVAPRPLEKQVAKDVMDALLQHAEDGFFPADFVVKGPDGTWRKSITEVAEDAGLQWYPTRDGSGRIRVGASPEMDAIEEEELRKIAAARGLAPTDTLPAEVRAEARKRAIRITDELRRDPRQPSLPSESPADKARTRQEDRAQRLASEFARSKPAVEFSEIYPHVAFAEAFDLNTTNPIDDYTLIVTLAKAVDPGSVAKEGEVETARRYAGNWLTTMGFDAMRVIRDGVILTPEQRRKIVATIQRKGQAVKQAYDVMRQRYAKRIRQSVGTDPEPYLLDAVPVGEAEPAVATTEPTIPELSADSVVGGVYMHRGQKVRVKAKTRTGFLTEVVR